MNKLLCLCLTFTSLFTTSLSCNKPQILDNRYLNCSEPLSLVPNCWYDFHISNNVPLCLKVAKETNTSKLFVEWEDVFNYFDIFLSWNSTPIIDTITTSINFHAHIPSLKKDGYVSFNKDVNKKDIYNCDKKLKHCEITDNNYENTGDLFISMYSSKSSGIIKFGFEEPNKYIKQIQLNFVKDLFNYCCKHNYIYTPPVLGKIDILKSKCDWKISEKLFKTNQIKESTNYGLNLLDTNSCDEITGILCDKEGNIIKISLPNMVLSGIIPDSFKFLTKLEILFIPFNNLSSHISIISQLPMLKELDLNGNNFYGSLPCFNKNINHISLRSNKISGVIPDCISELENLSFIDFSRNPFSKQKLPYINKKVSYLILSETNIYGDLYMRNNTHSINHLDLSGNFLSGKIPYYIFRPNLKYIDLSFNLLNGSLSKYSQDLIHADFSSNNLNGGLDGYLKYLNSNSFTDISYNNFRGFLPEKINGMLLLKRLIIKGNKFSCDPSSGTWPKWLFFVKELGHCYNNLTNLIPTPLPSYVTEPTIRPIQYPTLDYENKYNRLITIDVIITILLTTIFNILCYTCYYYYKKRKNDNYNIRVDNEETGEKQELIGI